jgi:nicotinate dehydrogenase subunit B
MNEIALARREFLKAGAGLCVSFAFSAPTSAAPEAGAMVHRTVDPAVVDSFLVMHPNGRLTLYTGKVDLGTGARIAYRQIVAEELAMEVGDIDVVEGDTALTPDQGRTAASSGITVGGTQLRFVAATARQALLGLGAAQLGRPVAEVEARSGMVCAKDDGSRSITYGALVGDRQFDLTVDKAAPLADPANYRIVGQPVPRPDLPGKLTGTHTYVHDFKLPGMLHGRTVRPPMSGSAIVSLDEASVAHIPGLVKVVRIGDFLGVVARTEWAAIRAAQTLKVSWTPKTRLPGSDKVYQAVRQGVVSHSEVVAQTGNAERALAAVKPISATYHWPAQSHGSIGPSCAVADVTDTTATVWTASQSTHAFQPVFARFLGLDPKNVRLVYLDGAGCYGMNGHEDAAADAAIMSQAVGKPVRLQWMREDEHGLDPKGPPQVLEMRGSVDTQGRIAAWETQAWLLENTKNLLTVTLLGPQAAGLNQVQGTFVGQQQGNTDPPYTIADMQTLVHWQQSTPLRAANLRAPGKLGNAFAVESFTDELAVLAGADPLSFRLQALSDPRARDVLQSVARRMPWQPRAPAFRTAASGATARGRGIAYVHFKQSEGYVAVGAEVEVDQTSGSVKVLRVVCAQDVGMMINPDNVHAQVEGNILQTISRVLSEEVLFDQERVTSLDWSSYPILTFQDIPILDIDLIDRRFEKSTGSGEAATAPVPAAIANAIYDATGIRLRQVPFTPARVKEALSGRAT